MTKNHKNTIYLTGGTGFVGSAVAQAWLAQSRSNAVVIQTRAPERREPGERVTYVASYDELACPVHALVNLAGAPIADGRWTSRRKRVLEQSRIDLTDALARSVRQSGYRPKVVVSASAIGFYGLGAGKRDETSPVGSGYAADLCRRWEAAAHSFDDLSRLVVLRLGVVLGEGGGALRKLLPLFKLGLGGSIGNGRQWFSWVHRVDVVNMVLRAIADPSWQGVYNATSPKPVLQRDFAATLGKVLRRPAFIPTPAFALAMVFGDMARELLIGGQKVLPSRPVDAGFDFTYPQLEAALRAIVND